MALLRLTDANLSPIVLNTDKILFVGPTSDPSKWAIAVDMPTPTGPFTIVVANKLEQIIDRWEMAIQGVPFTVAGAKPDLLDKN